MRAVLLTLFVLAACVQHPAPAADAATAQNIDFAPRIRADLARLDEQLSAPHIVAAGIGESADLGHGLIVRPVSVIEDSRCPQDVTCVWAGRLVVRVMVAGVEQNLTLGTTLDTPDGAISFVAAKPGAWASWPVDLPHPAYRFGFRYSAR